MSAAAFENAAAELRARLSRAQRRLRCAALRRQLLRGVGPLLWVGCILALLLAIWHILAALTAALPAASWTIYMAALAVAVGVVVALALAAAARTPDPRVAAERLDLATSDHNRIASALALATTRPVSPFVPLAIEDGLAAARRLEHRSPYCDPTGLAPRRIAVLAVAFLALNAIARIDLTPAAVGREGPAVAQAGGHSANVPPVSPDETSDPSDRPRARPTAPRPEPTAGHASAAEDAAPGDLPPPAVELRIAAAPAAAPGQARIAASPSGADGSGAAAQAPTNDQRGESPRTRKTTPSGPAQEPEEAPPSGNGDSSISSGGTGTGSATPVAHDWAQRDAAPGDDEGGDDDEPVEDEERSSTQRGGLQPSLKDRNAAPSRELGLGDNLDGPPGTGRGGPTPPKKSRGTASLVLGVPIPDFVRGQLGPGTTKVVRQRVTPSPAPGERAEAVAVPPRSRPEAPIRRFEVPGDVAGAVRAILVALHGAAPPTEAAGREMTDSTVSIGEHEE